MRFSGFVTIMTLAVLPFSANAAAINVSIFDAGAYNPTFGVGAAATEDFESTGRPEGEVGASLSTSVGTFSSVGGRGTGGTVTQLDGNTGWELALRNGDVFGRTNTTPNGGEWFLDSNDTWGINWDVSLAGGAAFDYLTFSLTDASDVGGYLHITTGTDTFSLRLPGDSELANGNVKFVTIDFGADITSANIQLANYWPNLTNYRRNDGFSIDGLQVFSDFNIQEVPVPASLLLLGSAVAGFGFAGRRKKAK